MKIDVPKNKRRADFARLYTTFHDSAYTRCVNMSLLDCDFGHATSGLQLSHYNFDENAPTQIHPLAIIGLVDHSAGSAIYTKIASHLGCSTLDLKVDFFSNNTTDRLIAETKLLSLTEHNAVIFSEVRNAENQAVASCVGLFRVGAYPGETVDAEGFSIYQPGNTRQALLNTLRLQERDGQCFSPADNPTVIGWAPANVFHGAATATLLAYSSTQLAKEHNIRQSLKSLHVNFVRPGRGGQKLTAKSELVRKGRSASMITATCHHEDGKTISYSSATYAD